MDSIAAGITIQLGFPSGPGGGGGVLLGIFGGGVLPPSPNPDPISDQQVPFSTLFSDLASKIHTRFQA